MYISKLCIFNFRSLKRAIIRLEKGKNVIVGKNNSGKSNIIRALDILVGERWPTFHNITENDFYTYEVVDEDTGEIVEDIAENFYLEVTLEGRDFDEEIIKSIKKGTAFSKIKHRDFLYHDPRIPNEFRVNVTDKSDQYKYTQVHITLINLA